MCGQMCCLMSSLLPQQPLSQQLLVVEEMGVEGHEEFNNIPESNYTSIPLENQSVYQTFECESSQNQYQAGMESMDVKEMNSTTITRSSSSSSFSSNGFISFQNPTSQNPMDPKSFYLTSTRMSNYKEDHINHVADQEIIEFGSPAYASQNVLKRTTSEAAEHVVAERLRREKLNQLFISLSALIPGRKKMDKASILQDAADYIKQLEGRLRILEEEANKSDECTAILTKNDDIYSSDNLSTNTSHDHRDTIMLPEIRAKVSGKNVLIKVHCKKPKGMILRILGEIQKLDLIVINSSVMQFGDTTFDVTVTAQMDVEFSMAMKDLVKELHSALLGLA